MMGINEVVARLREHVVLVKKIFNDQKDVKAQQSLSSLVRNIPFLPYTSSSLSHHTIQVILNDIIINKRKLIVEFGSGISTVYIAALIDQMNLDTQLVSFDSEAGWVDTVGELVKTSNKKLQQVSLIHAPLTPCSKALDGLTWFNEAIVTNHLASIGKPVDVLIVDGPYAHTKELKYSRFPALPIVNQFMDKKRFSVFLDDTYREGEKKIMELWNKEYSISLQAINLSSSHYSKGESFNIIP